MSAPTKTNPKQQLLRLEKKNWEAFKARDEKTLLSLFDDTYLMTMEEGITEEGKDEFVNMMIEGDMQLKSYKLDESSIVVRELTPDVAVIAYKARPEMEQAGKPLVSDYYFSTTYVKRGGEWLGAVGSAARAESPD